MSLRPEIGDFSSIICFRALVVGTEEALGVNAAAVTLKAAGRKRGKAVVKSLGLSGAAPAPDVAAVKLNDAVGPAGTRLCIVHSISKTETGGYLVQLRETICSADEAPGSERQLTFTFGAVWGAMEELYGVKLKGKQTESVLRGGSFDSITFEPV